MALLSEFQFSQRADIARSNDGWLLPDGTIQNALAGADTITGSTSDASPGVEVGIDSRLMTGLGRDIVSGTSQNGYGFVNEGYLDGGLGNDVIQGRGRFGIYNSGEIDTGAGDDSVVGVSGGGLDDGAIINTGRIDTGSGNDAIIGTGGAVSPGFIHDGIINAGPGADRVDARAGGLWGSGKVSLGQGSDTLISFCTWGTIDFDAGKGVDRILLDKNYAFYINKNQDGSFSIREPSVARPDGIYRGFELVGSFENEASIPLRAGTLMFDSAGIPFYA